MQVLVVDYCCIISLQLLCLYYITKLAYFSLRVKDEGLFIR